MVAAVPEAVALLLMVAMLEELLTIMLVALEETPNKESTLSQALKTWATMGRVLMVKDHLRMVKDVAVDADADVDVEEDEEEAAEEAEDAVEEVRMTMT